jgi:redox-sensing transcriptional repressor
MNEDRQVKIIPEPSLRRLPLYVSLLRTLREQGLRTVSCTLLSERLGQDPTQIRKDLAAAGMGGKPRVGFEVADLLDGLIDFLGWNNHSEAFLVGAGSLGTALLGHGGFHDNGLSIVAAFDTSADKVGGSIHGKPVFHLDKLSNLARRMGIRIGVITTPAVVAQDVADLLVASGICGIWNFAPVRLQVPGGVVCENASLTVSLGVLVNRLAWNARLPGPEPAAPGT